MVRNPIRQALILAHQTGPDGRALGELRTGGVAQLVRLLLSMRRMGVRAPVIAAGTHGVALRDLVEADRRLLDLDIRWTDGPAQGAVDAIASARGHLVGDFFLLSVEDVFAPEMLRALSEEPLDGVTLAATRRLRKGALGLRTDRSFVVEVGAARPDVSWTGVAACDSALFAALQPGQSETLEHVLERLAAAGRVRIADVGDAYWHHVRTTAARRAAERMMLQSLRKPDVDGPVARHLNRHFSLALTRMLMSFPVRPNHVTFVTLLVSLAAGACAWLATPTTAWMLGLGAVLWQLASMLDGTDGELARLKFQGSRAGEWFDTIVDDAGRVLFFLGLGYGLTSVSGNGVWWGLMVVTVLMQLTLNFSAYRKMLHLGSGTHFALAWMTDTEGPIAQTRAARFIRRIEFMGRRDYYIFLVMVWTVAGFATVAAVLAFATTCIVFGRELSWPARERERTMAQTLLARDDAA